jgi:replicative DNA helicase
MSLAVVPQASAVREPPFSAKAERAVIGAALMAPERFREINTEIDTNDLFMPAHIEIWDAMRALNERSRTPDVISVADELKARGVLVRIEGGEQYLLECANCVEALYLENHIRIVQERAQLRRLILACAEIQSRAYGDVGEVGEFLEAASARVLKVSAPSMRDDLMTVGDLIDPVMLEFKRRRERRESGDEMASVTGVRTGVTKLDLLTGGFQPGNLVVIAGGTSSGKTSLAAQAAIGHVLDASGVAMLINLEMTRLELAERAFAHVARVDSATLRAGAHDLEDHQRLKAAARKLVTANLYVEDSSFRVRDLTARFRRLRAKHPEEKLLGIVDFLQLVRGEHDRGLNRAQEVGRIAQYLKELGKELRMPMVVLSQLDRGWVKQDRPTKYNLKESGDIENAADIIILIHNRDQTSDGNVGLYVDKNRNGRCSLVVSHWSGAHYRFSDSDNVQSYVNSNEADFE